MVFLKMENVISKANLTEIGINFLSFKLIAFCNNLQGLKIYEFIFLLVSGLDIEFIGKNIFRHVLDCNISN